MALVDMLHGTRHHMVSPEELADAHVLQLALVGWRWGTHRARPSLHGEVVVVRLVSVVLRQLLVPLIDLVHDVLQVLLDAGREILIEKAHSRARRCW